MTLSRSLDWEADQIGRAISERPGEREARLQSLKSEVGAMESRLAGAARPAARPFASVVDGRPQCPLCYVSGGAQVDLKQDDAGALRCPDCGAAYDG